MASSAFQTVAALLLLAAAASARLVGPATRHGRSALESLRGGAGETQLANVDALPFREALPWLRHVRTHGILQFLAIHDERKDESTDELCWGDEIEYQLVWLDEEEKKCRVCLRAPEVLAEIQEKEGKLGRRDGFGEGVCFASPPSDRKASCRRSTSAALSPAVSSPFFFSASRSLATVIFGTSS